MAVLLVLAMLGAVALLAYLFDHIKQARRLAFRSKNGLCDVPTMPGRLPWIGHMAKFLMQPDKHFHMPVLLETAEKCGKTVRLYVRLHDSGIVERVSI